ncbi:MAG: MoxR family ATPase [Lachnospiraceae bacterium]|nr:MoxR family ATPase [Lachnospiraceae bacterium]
MINELKEKMHEYFVGREEIIENLLICLFAGGHVLLEDVPGVGKTTLARTLAKSLDCDFGRIQFTPDTMPGDVIGTEIFNMKTSEFEYRAGGIMHQIILADEINRTSPKTQSSLLEAMAEGQVTVGGVKRKLMEPFMVIATQNPVEFAGTYPLPEAQIDRFMMRLSIGYPSKEEELRLAKNRLSGKTTDSIESIISAEDVLKIREEVKKVTIKDAVLEYMREIIDLTRNESRFVLGASPRAMLSMMSAAQAKAYMKGRDFVKPDDVKAVAAYTLAHRLTLTSEAKIGREDPAKIITALILKAKVPME